ncbi:MAG: hypothetical protein LBG60_15640 [Bifidobacteriaceae bacterium]|jgi:hypothetical protein|nr:hypothetical protein [Bifidobacteriaceae bacterium]
MTRYKLPTWLDACLPDVREPWRIFLAEEDDGRERLRYRDPSGAQGDFEPEPDGGYDIEKAYDSIGGDGVDVKFSRAVCRRFSRRADKDLSRHMRSIFVPADEGCSRLLMSRTDRDRVATLERAWQDFLETDAMRKDKPGDFYLNWLWLDQHPAFWTRGSKRWPDHPDWRENDLWHWETSGAVASFWVHPFVDQRGRVRIALELGSHVASAERRGLAGAWAVVTDAYIEHCHDPLLDTFAKTYEDAIVRAAAKVDKFFDTAGEPRPGVKRKQPKWLRELEKRSRDTGCEGSARAWHESLPRVQFADPAAWSGTTPAEADPEAPQTASGLNVMPGGRTAQAIRGQRGDRVATSETEVTDETIDAGRK